MDKQIAKRFLQLVITPVLKSCGLYTEAAARLLLMIAAHESGNLKYSRQIKGPALGWFQMEPLTHDGLIKYLASKTEVFKRCNQFIYTGQADELVWHPEYAVVMARVFFLRFKAPLPAKDDLDGLAHYAKKYWNTHLGKATPADYLMAYKRIAP